MELSLLRSASIFALSVLTFSSPALAKNLTLRGYVTAVHSPTRFEIDNYKIIDDTEAEHQRLGIKSGKKDNRSPQLRPGTLRVGLEVEVKGDYEPKTGELKATGIKAIFDDSDPETPIESTGLVEDKTSLEKTAQGWSGRLTADGETIVLTPDTDVSVQHTRAERKELEHAGRKIDDAAFSPNDIDLDTFAEYVGVRQADHSILAKKILFQQNRIAPAAEWSFLESTVVYPDPKSETGELTIGERKYDLFPSPEAVDYLNKLAARLVPAHQKDLPDKGPGKVPFRFFVANTENIAIDTYPNGVIVVSVHLLDTLENEAQLAFVLAHEMARVVEKQSWTVDEYHEKTRKEIAYLGAAGAVVIPGAPLASIIANKKIAHHFQRGLQNQADRVGVEYMIAAGYDPKQAVESWRVLEEKHAKGPFWGDRDLNFLRRTYLESELNLNYANRDFSNLKTDSPEFHRAVDAIKAARERKKPKKGLVGTLLP